MKTVTNRGPEVNANDGGDTEVRFYYDQHWRIVETRDGSGQVTQRMLWGTQYTDELVWIEVNGDPSIGDDSNPDNEAAGEASEDPADMRYYAHQDRNWNVTALTEYDPSGTNNGRVVERYEYTPYSQFVVLTGDTGSGETAGRQLVSTVGNLFAHQGLPFDHDKGSYQNRWRGTLPRSSVVAVPLETAPNTPGDQPPTLALGHFGCGDFLDDCIEFADEKYRGCLEREQAPCEDLEYLSQAYWFCMTAAGNLCDLERRSDYAFCGRLWLLCIAANKIIITPTQNN